MNLVSHGKNLRKKEKRKIKTSEPIGSGFKWDEIRISHLNPEPMGSFKNFFCNILVKI